MATLNYHHLRLFRTVAHAGSLVRAAARLNLSQSALSAQLKTLQQQLGHPLFERVGRGLALTAAGRIALDYADTVFQAGDELVGTLGGRPAASRPVLRVGAQTTLSRNFQLAFLRPLVGRADVDLVVRAGAMRDLLAGLDAHAIDVVLANGAAPRDARSQLRSQLLDQQPVSLVGPRRPRGARFRFPDDLRDRPVLLPGPDSDIRVAFDQILDLAGIRPIVQAEVDDMAMLRLLARDSAALALVPPIVVRDELKAGLLVEHCRVPGLTESFFAITRRRRFPNP